MDDRKRAILKEMLELQDKLNKITCGNSWRSGLTDENRDIDWDRCIYMEAAELMDSFPWKHWKSLDEEPDIVNAKVEAVDIWHFIMSDLLTRHSIDASIKIVMEYFELDRKVVSDTSIVKLIEHIMLTSLCSAREPYHKVMAFSNLISKLDMSLEDLYEMYLIKNTLNIFRQDHGYKDGSYIKVIDNIEDNKIMLTMSKELARDEKLTYDNLYDRYEEYYNNAVQDMNENDK